MSAFSFLEILKSNAKQLAKKDGTGLSVAQGFIAQQAGFKDYHELSAVAKSQPYDVRLMKAALGVSKLADAVHEDDVWAELDLALEGILSGSIVETNAESFVIDGMETKTSSYDEKTGVLTLDVSFTYRGIQDTERPFFGSAYYLNAIFRLRRRNGKWSVADHGVELTHGKSDQDRDSEEEWEEEPPKVPLTQALMDELDLTEEEAESVVDVDVVPRETNDGMITAYWLDFDAVAQEPLRSKLIKQYGSLLVEVDQNFFDNVESSWD